MKVKTFLIAGTRMKPLADSLDAKVGQFLADNPEVDLEKYEIAADLQGSFPSALVSIVYTGDLSDPKPEATEGEEKSESKKPGRKRKPKPEATEA